MSPTKRSPPGVRRVSATEARRVLLRLQGLASEPKGSSSRAVQSLVERLGYVQIDSINVVERAHHLILGARLAGYRHEHLRRPLETTRALFEHWTHDACAIPTRWFPHWRHRFAQATARAERSAWWSGRFRGDPQIVMRRVLERVRAEGPLRARDFEPPEDHVSQGWWEWHPEKAALEHLWRSGRLAIARRERFEKVYDLTERVLAEADAVKSSSEAEHCDWACRAAIERIGIGTAREIADFFRAIPLGAARNWCAAAVARGELVEVEVEEAVEKEVEKGAGTRTRSFALPDWQRHAEAPARSGVTLLCPFDPLVRERKRLERLFAFDYRFEAFVPEAKRRYGYYVFPMLAGDRMVGRADLKFDRERGVLLVRGAWWEPGVRVTRRLASERANAFDELAARIGAVRVESPASA
jgi:uncharacterized protein YcaQ